MVPVDVGPYFVWITYPSVRIRTEFEKRRGVVMRFVVQLEYNSQPDVLEADDWRQVARFDHDPAAPGGHDVTKEGLHMDIYSDGKKVAVARDFSEVPLNEVIDFCERVLRNRSDELLARFKQ